MISSGSGFVDDETITITDDKLGGGGGAPLTFDVNGIKETSDRVAGTYTIGASDYTTNGNGSGATFKVVIDLMEMQVLSQRVQALALSMVRQLQ